MSDAPPRRGQIQPDGVLRTLIDSTSDLVPLADRRESDGFDALGRRDKPYCHIRSTWYGPRTGARGRKRRP